MEDGGWHPLICHMLDTAAVAAALWRDVLPASVRASLAGVLGLPEDVAGRWIAFLAGLHDIGKATPPFQSKWPAAAARLRKAGFGGLDNPPTEYHGTLTAALLPDKLMALEIKKPLAQALARAVGGHHGVFPTANALRNVRDPAQGGNSWRTAQAALFDALKANCEVEGRGRSAAPSGQVPLVLLAGLTTVADWIASNERFFEHAGACAALEGYARRAADAASRALDTLFWKRAAAPSAPAGLRDLFPAIERPTPVQEAAVALADDLAGPALVILEVPTGEGKTEAALYLADQGASGGGSQGFYFALPTMATSDQMFGRVRDFLERRHGDGPVPLQLLHGHAALSAEFEVLQDAAEKLFDPTAVGEDEPSDRRVVASEWFTHRKRGLLGPFGVGTVDQGLLAVLQTWHVFVRLFGLAGKTVIVDEVHAYDAYMTALLERLLEWLAALGCPVALLSATLPRAKRVALEEAYRKGLGATGPAPAAPEARYPRVTWADRDGRGAREVGASPRATRTIRLKWLAPAARGPDDLGRRLSRALAPGGCAAVVCNTVQRAQEVYGALKTHFPAPDAGDGAPELDLLHARYPYEDRKAREKRAYARFGPPGAGTRRPHRAVLVATQVIEQSVDLDFDLMVTDMAPADLLLQRAGRLRRHAREGRPGQAEPTLWVVSPEVGPDGVPRFEASDEWVYDGHVLLRTWLALRERGAIAVPGDVEALIEATYGEQGPPAGLGGAMAKAWQETLARRTKEIEEDAWEASARWIPSPVALEDIKSLTADSRDEDHPEWHKSNQALTRLTGPTVEVVCLDAEPGPVPPGLEAAKGLLQRSLPLSHGAVAPALLRDETPPAWRRSALLRHHRALVFDSGHRRVGRFDLRLDPELGLVIEKGAP